MFPRIKTELLNRKNPYPKWKFTMESTIIGVNLYDYLDELQNSKVFRNSEIEIILDRGTTRLKIWTEPITKWTRFKGKVYLSSISLGNYSTWNGDPPSRKEFYISGNFDRCKISYDMETAIKLDRLYELDKLDV